MKAEDIQREIAQIIGRVLEVGEAGIEGSTALRELPGIESIKVLRIITKIETQYGVELDEQVVFNIGTLDELVAEVVRLQVDDEPAEQRAVASQA